MSTESADLIRLKKCECGWAVERKAGRWVHVQTGSEECITAAVVATWGSSLRNRPVTEA